MVKTIEEYKDYLEGKKFDNYMEMVIPFENKGILQSRKTLLKELVQNKKIIHVGCVDHLEIIDEKIQKGEWMHKILSDPSARCLGVDIVDKGVEYMKNKLGYADTICHNLLTDPPSEFILNDQWDYIILGEILEHVDNPVQLLSAIKMKYGHVIKRIIVTVPNAFGINNFRKSFKNIEHVNTDHRYWFTPYTASKVLTMAGINPYKIYTCTFEEPSTRGFFSKRLLKRYPLFRDTLIVEGSF